MKVRHTMRQYSHSDPFSSIHLTSILHYICIFFGASELSLLLGSLLSLLAEEKAYNPSLALLFLSVFHHMKICPFFQFIR